MNTSIRKIFILCTEFDKIFSVDDGDFKIKNKAKTKKMIRGIVMTILVSHSLKQIKFGDDVHEICKRYRDFLDKRNQLK